MTTKPRIAIVIGSTRPGRYADKAAGWMLKQTQARNDIEAELVDLRDHPMPFFDEKGPPMSTPSENAEALRWQKTLARYDGFVFVVADYNSSITGALKNALDQAYKEWGRKPFTAIGYDIEAHLLASTKSALDELVWWAHATMAAKAAEASSRRDPNELAA